MEKNGFHSIAAKNRTIDNLIGALTTRQCFLMLGHENPDEDCIASMVAFALLAKKFFREAFVYLGREVHEHFHYLLNICRYNSVGLLDPGSPCPTRIDAIVLCDTPKPGMIEASPEIRRLFTSPEVLKIEVDHHLGADTDYFGDPGYRLVEEATASAELVGHVLLKLRQRKELLRRLQIIDLTSRNLVLAILTGIVGDSKMGLFLKSRREEHYYGIFSTLFNDMLTRLTHRATNFSNMEQVFNEIQKLSAREEECYGYFLQHARFQGMFGLAILDSEDMRPVYEGCDRDTVVSVARAIADRLAEESGKLSLVVYCDNPAESDLVQFRIRRSYRYRELDLRVVLDSLQVRNGGGHEGAIAFRLPSTEVPDLDAYVERVIRETEELAGAQTQPS